MPVTELVINRPNWLRGKGSTHSYLLRRSDQKMCCLGFYSLACGLKREHIICKQAVHNLSGTVAVPEEMGWLVSGNDESFNPSGAAGVLMNHNDTKEEGDAYREAEIIRLFEKQGIKVTFTDDPLPEVQCQATE